LESAVFSCEWDECLIQLETGEIDLLAPIAYSEERAERFDFNEETLITNWGQVYVRPDQSNISLLDLEGQSVGVLKDDIHAEVFRNLLDDFEIDAEILYLDTYFDILQAVEDGEVVGGVVNHIFSMQYASDYDIRQSAIIFNPIEVRFAATKGMHAEVLTALDQNLNRLKRDRSSLYYQSLDRWLGGISLDEAPLPVWILWVAAGVTLSMLLFFWLTRLLKAEIFKATAEVEASREELALIIDNIPTMVSYLDQDQRYLYVDRSYAAWYGLSKEDIVGKFIKDILPPETYEKVRPKLAWVIENGQEHHYQHSITRSDGEVRTVAVSYIPHLDKQGKVKGFFATVTDISDRMQVEVDLKESEEKYRTLVDNTLVGIYIIQNGKVCFANQGLADIFGYATAEELQQKTVQELIALQDWPLVRDEIARKESEEGSSSQYSFEAIRRDGSMFTAEILSRSISYHGKPALQGVLIDITARVQAEERFRSLSEASYEALFISEKGICLEQNAAAERLFGYTMEEAVGQPGTNWIVEKDRDMVMHHMLTGYDDPYRATALRKDGTTFPCEITGRMMEYRGRKVRVTALRDISAQIEAEKSLRENKERFERVVAEVPVPLAITDPNGDISFYNDRFTEVFGYTLDDIRLAEDWWQRVYPDEEYRQQVRRSWEEATVKAEKDLQPIAPQVWNMVCKDGQIRTVEFNMMPMGDISVIAMNDVTARTKVEKILRDSEQRYRNIIENSLEGMFQSTLDGRFLMANPAMAEIYGYDSPAELIKEVTDIREELYVDGNVRDHLIELLHERAQVIDHIEQNRRKDGSLIWIRTKARLIHAEGEKPTYIEGFLEDVTERVNSEKALQEREEKLQESEFRLRTLINATPDIICFKDGEGRWLIANQADLDLFELTDVDYVGKKDSELAEYSEFYREAFLTCEETDEIAWQAGSLSRAEEVIPTPLGEDKIYDVIKVPLFKEDGSREALVVWGRDITEQVADQQQLQQHARQLEIVNVISEALSTSLALEELLKTILYQVVQVIPCDSASVFLIGDDQKTVKIVHAIGDAERFIGKEMVFDGTLMAAIDPQEKVFIVDDVLADERFQLWKDSPTIRGWMGLPLYTHGTLVGYLTFDSERLRAFDRTHADLAVAFSPSVAQALHNATLYERVISDANDLERRVQKRTEELQNFVDMTAGREIRMLELKEMIRELRKQLIRAGHVPVMGEELDGL
jgi:PAS domain S-box-containing protein